MDSQFAELKKFSDFEILCTEPFTIRNKITKQEGKPRLSNGTYRFI